MNNSSSPWRIWESTWSRVENLCHSFGSYYYIRSSRFICGSDVFSLFISIVFLLLVVRQIYRNIEHPSMISPRALLHCIKSSFLRALFRRWVPPRSNILALSLSLVLSLSSQCFLIHTKLVGSLFLSWFRASCIDLSCARCYSISSWSRGKGERRQEAIGCESESLGDASPRMNYELFIQSVSARFYTRSTRMGTIARLLRRRSFVRSMFSYSCSLSVHLFLPFRSYARYIRCDSRLLLKLIRK